MEVRRGEIYYADLNPVMGSEQGGLRPVLIIQNDIGNRYAPTVIVVCITSQTEKSKLPTHVKLEGNKCGLLNRSMAIAEQLRTLDKNRLQKFVGFTDVETMSKIDTAILVSCGIG